MKTTPLIFNAEMVRAKLGGLKDQTRRLNGLEAINADPDSYGTPVNIGGNVWAFPSDHGETRIKCPFGGPGDLIWCRETWGYRMSQWSSETPEIKKVKIEYIADKATRHIVRQRDDDRGLPKQRDCRPDEDHKDYYDDYLTRYWEQSRPSIFMPRWASRLTDRITDVRVQRVQEINHNDAVAEGVGIYPHSMSAQKRFAELWDSINAKRGYGWEVNPYCWCLSFEVIKANVDQVLEEA